MKWWKCCSNWKHPDLVLLLSIWDSNQWLFDHHQCWRIFPLCYSWSLFVVVDEMAPVKSSHSSCPSRLSRLHPWFWQSHMDRWWCCHSHEHQSGWTPATISSHSPLLSFLSFSGCLSSCQGSLVRLQYLWYRVFQDKLKNIARIAKLP